MNSAVENLIRSYPENAQETFLYIRSLIFEIAESKHLGSVEETLNWGQPAYLCKTGSTIRIDLQSKNPDSVDIFFNCKTVLVESFKELFANTFTYRGKRVVSIPLNQTPPEELEVCLFMALNYHQLKKLPLLGA